MEDFEGANQILQQNELTQKEKLKMEINKTRNNIYK